MKYYAIYNEETGELSKSNCIITNMICIEISKKVYNELDKYMYSDGEIVLNPNYDTEQAEKREADFKTKFFEITGFGWYRKQPKGYSSAVESLNTAFNRFTVMQKMGIDTFPANVFIFYTQPDFTKPEECTEEWLVAHQFRNEEMTVQEFGSFYATFTDAWNTEEHE